MYRTAGNVEGIVELLWAREIHRFMATVPAIIGSQPNADSVLDVAAAFVEAARTHPVVTTHLEKEPAIAGTRLVRDLPSYLERAVDMLTPMLTAIMQAGYIGRSDPTILASALVRLVTSLIIASDRIPARDYLAAVLGPLLTAPALQASATPPTAGGP